jgi:hypothetical protein
VLLQLFTPQLSTTYPPKNEYPEKVSKQGIVRVEQVLKVLKRYLTKLPRFDWLKAVEEDTCFDTDVMDTWEAMYDSLKPEFTLKQVSRVSLDGFVDVK